MHSIVNGGGAVAVHVHVQVGLLQEQLDHLVVVLHQGDHQARVALPGHPAVDPHPRFEGCPDSFQVAIAAMLQKKVGGALILVLKDFRHSELIVNSRVVWAFGPRGILLRTEIFEST